MRNTISNTGSQAAAEIVSAGMLFGNSGGPPNMTEGEVEATTTQSNTITDSTFYTNENDIYIFEDSFNKLNHMCSINPSLNITIDDIKEEDDRLLIMIGFHYDELNRQIYKF